MADGINAGEFLANLGRQIFDTAATATANANTTIVNATVGILAVFLALAINEAMTPLFDNIVAILARLTDQTDKARRAEENQAKHLQNISKQAEAMAKKTATVKIKPEAPEKFDGKPERVNAFVINMTLYLKEVGETNLDRQIHYALSKIQGGKDDSASRWADTIRESLMEKHFEKIRAEESGQTEPAAVFPDWDSFVD